MKNMDYTLLDIKHAVSDTYYDRGIRYYNKDRVTNLEAFGDKILGKVRGTILYHQIIMLSGNGINGICSCPVEYNCKHVAAVLIAALNKNNSNSSIPSAPTVGDDNIEDYETRNWLNNIDNAYSISNKNNLITTQPKKLVYLLSFKKTKAQIQPFNCAYKKNGQLSAASKSYSANNRSSGRTIPKHFTEDDQYIIYMIDKLSGYGDYDNHFEINSSNLLDFIVKTGKCYWQNANGKVITLGKDRNANFSWEIHSDGQQTISASTNNPEDHVISLGTLYYINGEQACYGKIKSNIPENMAGILFNAPSLKPEDVAKVNNKLLQYNKEYKLPQPKTFRKIIAKSEKPRAILHLHAKTVAKNSNYSWYDDSEINLVMASVSFVYGNTSVALDNINAEISYLDGDKLVSCKRNKTAEHKLLKQLLYNDGELPLEFAKNYQDDLRIPQEYESDLIATDYGEAMEDDMEDFWVYFQAKEIPRLRDKGWDITIDNSFPYQIKIVEDEWFTNIDDSSGMDWFSLDLGVNVDGKPLKLLPILLSALNNFDATALESDTPPDIEYVMFPQQEGSKTLALPADRVWKMLRFLKDLYSINNLESDGTLRMSRVEATNLADLEALSESLNMRWFGGEKLLKLGKELKNFTGIKDIIPPKSLKADLRDYQKDGLNWMQFLREYQLAGILADDMGLGKTIQALAYIMYEKEQNRLDKPILVVAPTSVLVNWRMETERFAPTLKTLALHGSDRKKYFDKIPEFELVLTTYPLLNRDRDVLLEQEFHTVILDEAQYIKNSKAKNTQVACQLKADNRICMTGTPIENHLGELWSQFNFLLPGFLGDSKQFRQFFRTPIEKSGDADRNAALAKRIKPFMLRRTKEEIATELPPKTIIIRTASLDKSQRDLYEIIRISMQKKVQEEIAKKGLSRSHIIVLEALLRLRQTCCDPRLLKMETASKVKVSAKLEMLMDMVPEMVDEGRKILIFSQFTSMLSLIQDELVTRKIDYVKITGQTKNRKTPIERFQKGEVPIFLISLKAGGTGLNLTAADTVIHYDPWWNPAAENQATDRAYRIGQDKPVFVYKLLTEGTVEEKILEMQKKKAALANGIFDPNSKQETALTQDDINALFEPLSE